MAETRRSQNSVFTARLPRLGLFLGTLIVAVLLIPFTEYALCPKILSLSEDSAAYWDRVVMMATQGFSFLLAYLLRETPGITNETLAALARWVWLIYLLIAIPGIFAKSQRTFRSLYIAFIVLLCANIAPALIIGLSLASHISFIC